MSHREYCPTTREARDEGRKLAHADHANGLRDHEPESTDCPDADYDRKVSYYATRRALRYGARLSGEEEDNMSEE